MKNEKVDYFMVVALVLIAGPVTLKAEGLGLGIILGEPTGLSGKMWMGGNTAVDAAAAWSFGDNGALHLHADYLFHKDDLLEFASLYYGLGAKVKLMDDVQVGIRVPVGLVHELESAPIEIFWKSYPD
ncbi:MAG: hypothetical protein ACP5D8_01445 [Fidelibacterota bacterium]